MCDLIISHNLSGTDKSGFEHPGWNHHLKDNTWPLWVQKIASFYQLPVLFTCVSDEIIA